MEDTKDLKKNNIRMHFWLTLTLSVLLFVVFVVYLPQRFYHQSTMMNMSMPGMEMGEDGSMVGMVMGPSVYSEEGDVTNGPVVNFNFAPVPLVVGRPTRLDFLVKNKPENTAITISSLQVNHEKLMHVIGVRSDMDEFFHIHPGADDVLLDQAGIMSTEHVFDKPGRYKLWSEITNRGTTYTFGHPDVTVVGEGVSEDKRVVLSRNIVASGYQVSLSTEPGVVVQKKNVTLSLDLHSSTGEEVKLDPYLGVPMHMAIIKDDWSEFIHTHPTGSTAMADASSPTTPLGAASIGALADAGHAHTVATTGGHGTWFDVSFPSAGIYKIYAQFRPKDANLPVDDYIVASFWVKVEEKSKLPVSEWWLLLIVSFVLIAVLGYGTKKFIQVK